MLFAAFIGAFVFGRFADVIGRKRVYWIVAFSLTYSITGRDAADRHSPMPP